jgi:hypothetical protein
MAYRNLKDAVRNIQGPEASIPTPQIPSTSDDSGKYDMSPPGISDSEVARYNSFDMEAPGSEGAGAGRGSVVEQPGERAAYEAEQNADSGNSDSGNPSETNASGSNGGDDFQYSKFGGGGAGSKPGKRLQNPLGDYMNYTYQLTLYMVTPQGYDAFVNSGRNSVTASGSFYIVCQSGGVNNGFRAPNFQYDYGIDNLQMIASVAPQETGSSVLNIQDISFQIFEPYGFSFMTNLRRAADALYGSNPQVSNLNLTRQNFILGIRFHGYDVNGVAVSSTDLFEQFIDIQITEMKFKLDGRMVVYNIKALNKPIQSGFNISKGTSKFPQSVTAGTVKEAVEKYLQQVNKSEKDLAEKGGRKPTKYTVNWLDGTDIVYNSVLTSKTEKPNGNRANPANNVDKTADSNPANEKANQNTNTTKIDLKIANDQPMVQAINDIVKQSQFMENQVTVLYPNKPDPDDKKKDQDPITPDSKSKSISWISSLAKITNQKWDTKINNYSYDIEYGVSLYNTPAMPSPVVDSNNLYPGPVKRYEYWYTGQNSEVLHFEQNFDGAYMATVVGVGNDTDQNAVNTADGLQPNQSRAGRSIGSAGASINSFMTALYDPKALSECKITILGDPDLLPSYPSFGEGQIYDQYYTSQQGGKSVNFAGGQTFIEVHFNEGVDYNNSTGVMDINGSILLVEYPANIQADLNSRGGGIIYQLVEVTSIFQGGNFKQILKGSQPLFGQPDQQAGSSDSERSESDSSSSNTDSPAGSITPASEGGITAAEEARYNSYDMEAPGSEPSVQPSDPPLAPVGQNEINPNTGNFIGITGETQTPTYAFGA